MRVYNNNFMLQLKNINYNRSNEKRYQIFIFFGLNYKTSVNRGLTSRIFILYTGNMKNNCINFYFSFIDTGKNVRDYQQKCLMGEA